MHIKEVIVVEGRDDETAVKQAVNAEIIITHGFGIREKTFKLIKEAQKRCGVIVLTDPDHAGEQIRKRISARVPGVKHAFIPRDLATKDDNIGVENASPEAIREGLKKAHVELNYERLEFTKQDLLKHDLLVSPEASSRRDQMGKLLGIGYGNAKTFLKRLNHYGITREEFEAAASELR